MLIYKYPSGVLADPTGGFLAGYILAAFITGMIVEHHDTVASGRNLALCISAMATRLMICYTSGTLWFMIVTGSRFIPSMLSCVVPFIFTDIIKIIVAALLVTRLRKII